ncbi:HipA domain-containing protein [Comamonas sp. BIGb0124]|uniref:HipA domain-containing protein n=1 Tax=Comamonas sp. BIGb0124 TaxID=2485130 RepID=UPI0011CDF499|nr:HipA domain-containing protein [Comamonas sp. BIGb0124]
MSVPDGAAINTEPLGTKYKFWYQDTNLGLCLFKEGRPNTGENWAEKVTSHLAEILGIPHAQYELATYEQRRGVITPTLATFGSRIIHGNEILAALAHDAHTEELRPYRNTSHKLQRVLAYFKQTQDSVAPPAEWDASKDIHTALDVFIGYIMFDAWIGNQDRHDQNWALIRKSNGLLSLSPSYDHGSSLARNLMDSEREKRLTTSDKGYHISTFATKAKSGFFPHEEGEKSVALGTVEAYRRASARSTGAAEWWKNRLASVDFDDVARVINDVPDDWMSEKSREFTLQLLKINQERILNAKLS